MCQVGSELLLTWALEDTVVPFISDTFTGPPVFCHRMSLLPSPLKSERVCIRGARLPITCQVVSVLLIWVLEVMVVPFINHMLTWPVLLFCTRMSLSPSPLLAIADSRYPPGGAGAGKIVVLEETVVPFISDMLILAGIAVLPEKIALCRRR